MTSLKKVTRTSYMQLGTHRIEVSLLGSLFEWSWSMITDAWCEDLSYCESNSECERGRI